MSGINARTTRYGFSGCLNAGRMPKQPEMANRAPYGLLASRALAGNIVAACGA